MARSGFATSLKPLGCFVPWTLLARRSASAPASPSPACIFKSSSSKELRRKSSTMSPSPRSSSKEGQNVPPSGRAGIKACRVSRAPPPWRLGVRAIAPSLASPRSGVGTHRHQLRKGTKLFDREKEFFPTLARSRQISDPSASARHAEVFSSSGARDAMSRLRQLPRALGKTLAAGATTGRAREAIFGGETFRVFTSTRGALRPSRRTSSGTSAGSGGRRGRVPA